MPNVQEASRPRVAGWHSWRELVLTVVLIVAGDFAFRLVGQAFLFSPWAASGDLIIAEELYWLAGRRPDVVLMGDSRTGDGLKPLTIQKVLQADQLPMEVVSTWLAGAGPADGRQLIRQLLASDPPELVVFNLNENRLSIPAPVASERWDAQLLRSWPSYPVWEETVQWRARQVSGTLRWGAFVKRAAYNAVLDAGRIVLLGQSPAADSLGARRGYLPRFGQQRAARLEGQQAVDDVRYANYEVTDWALAQFDAFLAEAQASQVRLVVVLLPVPSQLFAKFPPDRYAAFVEQAERLTAAYGVPLINYYQDSRLPPEAFFDFHHLNDSGAEAFSRLLAEEVIAPALADWDQFKRTHNR